MIRKLESKSLLVYVILLSVNTSSNKLRSPGLDSLNSIKTLNDCDRCKVLSESFSYWLKKTSRGKYDGGDAAWEESKLKSYARSEVRLVEIQEGLCSELTKHQDHCYIMSEKAEQVLEKWWFHEDPNSVDLYTWLCIETLKDCCPINHFGDTCTLCPLVDSKICSGNGKCDGDGTRQGSGACICKEGYTGNNCESCATNFFSSIDGSCKRCHWACNGCSGEGPSACHSCKSGWGMEAGICVDIDECLSQSRCKSNEVCINKEGSFKCAACHTSCKTCAGIGAENCTLCEPLDVLWGGMCITNKRYNEILLETLKKVILYVGLIILAFVIHLKYNKPVLYIFHIFFAILVYYLEPMHMNTLHVIMNIFRSFDPNKSVNHEIKT